MKLLNNEPLKGGTGGRTTNDDLISRKAVIKAVDRHTRDDGTLDADISIILEEVETTFDKEKDIKELMEYSDDPCTLHEYGVRSEYCSSCIEE